MRDITRAGREAGAVPASSTPTRTRSWSTAASCGCSTGTRRLGPYPYSQSIHPSVPAAAVSTPTFNYVRNSVKATVDAYDGTVKFYVVDPNDPIIQAYQKAFPDLFTTSSDDARRAARSTCGTRRTSSERRPSSSRSTT